MGPVAIKMYDKLGRVLRIETTTNDVTFFKHHRRGLDQLDSIERVVELQIQPENRLEPLAGDRRGQHSIRINQRYRICFSWSDDGPDSVEIVDYHSG